MEPTTFVVTTGNGKTANEGKGAVKITFRVVNGG